MHIYSNLPNYLFNIKRHYGTLKEWIHLKQIFQLLYLASMSQKVQASDNAFLVLPTKSDNIVPSGSLHLV